MRRRTLALVGAGVLALGASGIAWTAYRSPSTPASLAGPPRTEPLAGAARPAPAPAEERRDRRAGSLDLTFLVFSDTHFGFDVAERDIFGRQRDPVKNPEGVEAINFAAITDMNAIAGKPWPPALGGTISQPRGLLISGDLTENGEDWEWRHFASFYGLKGGDGLLRYPVFEGHGNHDKHRSWYVLDRVRERHGWMFYSFDWDDLYVACLGEAPDDAALAWLQMDLATAGHERPVLVYFHFPLLGPWAESQWFGRGDYRERLRRTLSGYNVVALFHGHYHASGHYRWHDWDVYNVGAAKHGQHSFAVVHVSDTRLRVASWRFKEDRWEWWHDKPINGANGSVALGGTHAYSGRVLEDG